MGKFASWLAFSMIALTCWSESKPMNVVLIMADDLGYGDLGAYGATKIDTPHCDRLAREGMMFTDAHSPSAVCTPTRYSVLTGRYCWRTWLKNWVIFEEYPLLIEQDRLTLGKMFQNNGYRSICVGKWHLGWGDEPRTSFNGEVSPGPLEVGFDDFFGVPHSHNSQKAYQVFMRDREIVGLPEGLDFRSREAMVHTVRSLEDTAIDLSKEAVAYIEKYKDEPFFLFYPTTNVHFPITPNDRFKGQSNAGPYGDFVAEFDWAVGEVLECLDRLGLTENTIVIVTSDNGARPMEKMNGHLPNGEWRGTKRMIFEAGHRVPFIVRWPRKVAQGSISEETVCLTDLMRSFAALLQVDLPKDAAEDSYDILPILFGQTYSAPLREATVHHSVNGTYAIRQGEWKLIEGAGDGDYEGDRSGRSRNMHFPGYPARNRETGEFYPMEYDIRYPFPKDGPPLQLYNLKDDPRESANLARSHADKARELLELLNRYRDSGRSVAQ
ncbi:MAG: arylsulfatase [Verrucomicrobiota bacterium]